MTTHLKTWLERSEVWSVLDHLYDGAYVTDPELQIVYWNPSAEAITGYRREHMLAAILAENVLPHLDAEGVPLPKAKYPLALTLRDGRVRAGDLFLRHHDGYQVPVAARVAPIRNKQGEVIGGVEIFRDNSVEVAALAQVESLKKIAWLDALTQVGNRRYTETRLQTSLAEQEHLGQPFGLLFLDVDHFKKVNDTYGHDAGDLVLKMVARTLAHNLKSSDFVGRWGGEEFLVLVTNVDEAQLLATAEKLRKLILHSSLETEQGMIQVTASFGATLATKGDTPETLTQRADKLMYHSKSTGRNRVSFKLQRRPRAIPL